MSKTNWDTKFMRDEPTQADEGLRVNLKTNFAPDGSVWIKMNAKEFDQVIAQARAEERAKVIEEVREKITSFAMKGDEV